MTQHQKDKPIKKWAKDLNRHYSKEDIQRAHRYGLLKQCSTALAIREIQIKTTMRYHFTLVRMSIINRSTNNKLMRLWREVNLSTLLVGTHTGATTVENSMDFPQKTTNGTAF